MGDLDEARRYGATGFFWHKKLAEDRLEQFGVPFVAIRPGAYLDQVAVTSGDPFTNRRFTWLGNPAIPITFVLTLDVARNLVDVVEAEGVDGQRIDIGWDRPVSMNDLAQIAGRQLGRPIRVRAIPIGLLHTARTLLGPFAPTVTDLSAMTDWFQTGRFVADTTRQSEIFGRVPTAEDAVARFEESLGHRPR